MQKRFYLFLSIILFAAAVGCNGTTAVPTPTMAAIAALPVASSMNSGQTAAGSGLPPTWTPPATVAHEPGKIMTLQPTPLPTSKGTIPTRTPRPPTATAVGSPTVTPFPTASPTSSPTPTGTPPAIPTHGPITIFPGYPTPRPSHQSRLGIHVIRNNSPKIMQFVRDARPAVVKAVDDLGFLAEVKQVSPHTITVGRVNNPLQSYHGSPEDSARHWVNSQLHIYRANPTVDYWEGWNEPDPNLSRMSWYARFEQERIRQLAAHGFKAGIGGFSTGVPEMDEFLLFIPAIETALEYGGVLTLHEYSAPDITYLYGDPLPGYPTYPDRGSLTFRYRWFYREYLEPAGLVIPLIITEAGVDGVIGNRPGPEGRGWHDFEAYWVAEGWGRSGAEAYINQLHWYDQGVRQDPYVLGFTVFSAGGINEWEEYDINDILPDLANYVLRGRP